MAENLIDLRRRINSVKNTQKITKAMKTVSAAKLRKSVLEINRAKPVLEKLSRLLEIVIKSGLNIDNPLVKKKKGSESVFVILSSDKGLCGSFNSHILKKIENIYRDNSNEERKISLVTIGKKANLYFGKRDFSIKKDFPDLMKNFKYEDTVQISEYLSSLYINEDINDIRFIYTEFENASKQQIKEEIFLPISLKKDDDKDDIQYIFEPEPLKIFDSILPKFINLKVFLTMLSSSASEHAARMVAMELATQNAKEMIKNLTLTMNKLRQASITKELLEIITATEALTK